jgi:hypothetical protein
MDGRLARDAATGRIAWIIPHLHEWANKACRIFTSLDQGLVFFEVLKKLGQSKFRPPEDALVIAVKMTANQPKIPNTGSCLLIRNASQRKSGKTEWHLLGHESVRRRGILSRSYLRCSSASYVRQTCHRRLAAGVCHELPVIIIIRKGHLVLGYVGTTSKLSSEQGCWGRHGWCCKCLAQRIEEWLSELS